MTNGTKTGRTWQAYAENLQRSRNKVRKVLGARDGEPTAKAAERVATSGRRLGALVMDICSALDMPVTSQCEALVDKVKLLARRPAAESPAQSARLLAMASENALKLHQVLDACHRAYNRPGWNDSSPLAQEIVQILAGE